jgi:hypothetical protein
MAWIASNWVLILLLVVVVVNVVITILTFCDKPNEEKVAKFKEWLLFAVMEAEKELGSGTGQLKLRYVYDLALKQFPNLTIFISFEQFSTYVDEALDKFKEMIKSNKRVQEYVGTDKA